MKKFLSLILVIAFTLCMLVSCSDISNDGKTVKGKSAFEAYKEACEKLSAFVNYEYKLSQDQTIVLDGETVNYSNAEEGKVNGKDIYAVTTSDNELMMGESTVIFVDDWYYVSVMGQNMKANMSFDEFYKTVYGDGERGIFGNYLSDVVESWFDDVVFVEIEGGYKCSYDVDGETYMSQLKNSKFLQNLMGEIGMDMTLVKYSCDIYYDKDLNMTKFDNHIEFSLEILGLAGTSVIDQSFEISNVGKVGKINAPENADEYIDITELMSYTYQ